LSQSNKSFLPKQLHEDWVVFLLGILSVLFAFLHVIPTVPQYSWNSFADLQNHVLSSGNLFTLFKQLLYFLVVVICIAILSQKNLLHFTTGFICIYFLTLIAIVISNHEFVKSANFEAVIVSLIIGLFIGNVFYLPQWLKQSLTGELLVKIGLVLLGTTIVFSDILKAGFYGIVQALVVVLSVWYFAFWLCKKLKIDAELSMMLASAVSICGVSAAIATAGAIKGDTKKLSFVISLVLITAIPMMIGMPYLAKWMGLSQQVTGAWLGGSIDTTGAVVASGSLVGEEALKVSTIVKFSQNVLLGIAAFIISIYWSYTNKSNATNAKNEKTSLITIWQRFLKFVLAFILASFLCSFIVDSSIVNSVKTPLKNIQNLWFVLAFTSIGLETNFKELFQYNHRNALFAFLIAQTFNIIVTLMIAYILFR